MRATPEELANRNNQAEMREWILAESDPRKIQQLFHTIAIQTHSAEYQLARTAIEILIAESAERSSQRLERHTKHLLVITYFLAVLTAGLLLLTFALLKHP
jgi:hypothetical protein